ncbi:MAG: Maf family protein, partial [Quisquiliibacterium sp.]
MISGCLTINQALVSEPPSTRSLILASTSRYRRELLSRISPSFEVVAPHVKESALPGETPAQTAIRL